MTFATALTTIISDLSVNLSAGYFGAAILSPNLTRRKGRARILFFLTNYIVGGMLWLGAGLYLRLLL